MLDYLAYRGLPRARRKHLTDSTGIYIYIYVFILAFNSTHKGIAQLEQENWVLRCNSMDGQGGSTFSYQYSPSISWGLDL